MDKHTEDGRELFDPRPLEMPLGYKRPEPLGDMIRRMVHNELSTSAAAQGKETFEEADDYDVDDEDSNPLSHYQMREMEEEYIKDTRRRDEKNGKENKGIRVEVGEPGAESGLSGKAVPKDAAGSSQSGDEGGRIRSGRRASDRVDPSAGYGNNRG